MPFELIAPLLSMAFCALSLFALLRWRALPLDVPNQRSAHHRAVPRSGGLAIWAGWSLALFWLGTAGAWMLPAFGLAIVSFADDRLGLSIAARLPVHFLAAAWYVWMGFPGANAGLQIGLVLAFVWMLNLYNFMDGIDGLAGATAAVGFATFAWVAVGAGDFVFGSQLAALASACVAFLWFNWSPARVFLGDVGSVPLGFLVAALGSDGCARGLWPWWFPVLVFLPFIADATLTLAKRALRGERIWQAHREHAYQKVTQLGRGHAQTTVGYLLWMAGGAATAALVLHRAPEFGPLALGAWTLLSAAAYQQIMARVARAKEAAHAR